MAWDIFSVVSKLTHLVGMALLFGEGLAYVLFQRANLQSARQTANALLLGALLTILGTTTYMLAQVGAINGAGVGGMWDWQMLQILAESSLGSASATRLVAVLLGVVLAIILFWLSRAKERDRYALTFCAPFIACTAILLAWSTVLTGHIATLDSSIKAVLGVHFLAALAWAGTLWPLLRVCAVAEPAPLRSVMSMYGKVAVFVVALLVAAGVFLTFNLIASAIELVTTGYGLTLLLKLSGVLTMLGFAARHKLKLVPLLSTGDGTKRLQRSIGLEILVAILVLAVTAALTTVVGPENAHSMG